MKHNSLIFVISLISGFLIFYSSTCFAQSNIVVAGAYTYYAPVTMSLVQAKNEALQQAKLHLIADKFGTVVTSSTVTNLGNVNGQSSSFTSTFGESEVKGEWIKTIGEPKYDIEYLETENTFAVTVTVKGSIREIKTSQIELSYRLLSDAGNPKSECYSFHHGDRFFLQFKAPVNGYLAIYIYDGQTVARLLPDLSSQEGAVRIQGSEQYCFFDGESSSEMQFTTSSDMEVNRIYVIFSKNPFTRALDTLDKTVENAVPVQKFEDFQKWLSRCMSHDKDMTQRSFDVTIVGR